MRIDDLDGADRREIRGCTRVELPVEDAFQRELDIVGDDRTTVVELNSRAKLERPVQLVSRHHPGLSDLSNGAQRLRIEDCQAAVDVLEQLLVTEQRSRVRIEIHWSSGNPDPDPASRPNDLCFVQRPTRRRRPSQGAGVSSESDPGCTGQQRPAGHACRRRRSAILGLPHQCLLRDENLCDQVAPIM